MFFQLIIFKTMKNWKLNFWFHVPLFKSCANLGSFAKLHLGSFANLGVVEPGTNMTNIVLLHAKPWKIWFHRLYLLDLVKLFGTWVFKLILLIQIFKLYRTNFWKFKLTSSRTVTRKGSYAIRASSIVVTRIRFTLINVDFTVATLKTNFTHTNRWL